MTTLNEKRLQKLVNDILNSCSGTTWENETISKLKNKLKNELGMRDILIERYLNNHYA